MLGDDELLRALLARQMLLERTDLTPERAVEKLAGLQTQNAPTGYVGLFSRLSGFARTDLTDALHSGRVVQAWAMRSTIHMLSPRDYRTFTTAVRAAQRASWLRVLPDVTDEHAVAAAAVLREYLADGPRRQAEIAARLAEEGLPKRVFPCVQHWVELVRVPPAGTWETPRAHVYGLADTWLRAGSAPDEDAARAELVTRYLAAFGPASVPDVARFPGWNVTETRAVLESLDLRRFRDERGVELVDVRRAPLPHADTPVPVRFLGPFDAVLLLGHASRARIVPAEHREKVFATSMPRSTPTFLVDGRVAGTWSQRDGRVEVTPFGPLTASQQREVDDEAGRLAAWITA
ncbi:winged helix DNA-binding protein [Pseudonocardia endophytica]|uniref:Winged helix DNA-binding protein n=1 Tax=Pseudonocardia endophytica TaxID=401976 RepID=A0A4R1HUK7_PSEEN|nr:winged helix DNA-binding protein [Pseudonocardia endophytica]